MSERPLPGVAWPVGSYIQEELEARHWSAWDLSLWMHVPLWMVLLLLREDCHLSEDMAEKLGEAFGTGAEYWINLDKIYREWNNAQP